MLLCDGTPGIRILSLMNKLCNLKMNYFSKPLQAEHHDVILQSYEALPYISQLFTDPFNSIWALINPSQFQECTYDSKLSFQVPKDIPLLKTRIMRISKFINRGKRKNCLIVG